MDLKEKEGEGGERIWIELAERTLFKNPNFAKVSEFICLLIMRSFFNSCYHSLKTSTRDHLSKSDSNEFLNIITFVVELG